MPPTRRAAARPIADSPSSAVRRYRTAPHHLRSRSIRPVPQSGSVRLDGGALLGARGVSAAGFVFHRLRRGYSPAPGGLALQPRSGQPVHGLGRGRADAARQQPLLDFRSISLASQLGRVEAGEIELRDFDFYYARQHLARPAYLKMEALAEEFEDADPELVRLIREPLPQWGRRAGESSVWERIAYRPERFDVPENLRPMIEQSPRSASPIPCSLPSI